MAEVKVEHKGTASRQDAAEFLSVLARALAGDDKAEFPMGPSTVSLTVPDHVRTEVEVEVDGDEVEIEIEFSWSMSRPKGKRQNAG
jgi:amphi-Trp domain-containing protein